MKTGNSTSEHRVLLLHPVKNFSLVYRRKMAERAMVYSQYWNIRLITCYKLIHYHEPRYVNQTLSMESMECSNIDYKPQQNLRKIFGPGQLALLLVFLFEFKFVRGMSNHEQLRANAPWGYGNNSGGGYLGPDFWSHLPEGTSCNGTRQSPINFDTKGASRKSFEKDPLLFDCYDRSPVDERWTFVNNGHSVQLTTSFKSGERPKLRQDGLNGTYVFDQIHFHWGSDDDFGSEHTIDDTAAVLELHLVHKLENTSAEEIDQRPDGLAVIGILFEIGQYDNPKLESFVRNLERVAKPGSSVDDAVLGGHTLKELVPSNKTFFRYLGSLTTPPCNETVVWTVFTQKQKISVDQLAVFRTVLANNEELNVTASPPTPGRRVKVNRNSIPVSDNYRPVQPLNGREVFLYLDGVSSLSFSPSLLALFLLSLTLLDFRQR